MKPHFFSQVLLDIIGQWRRHLLSSGQKVKLIAAGNSWPSWPSWRRRWRRPVLSLAARHVKRLSILSQWARSRWTRKRRTTTRKPRDVYIFGASGEQKNGSLWSGRKRCGAVVVPCRGGLVLWKVMLKSDWIFTEALWTWLSWNATKPLHRRSSKSWKNGWSNCHSGFQKRLKDLLLSLQIALRVLRVSVAFDETLSIESSSRFMSMTCICFTAMCDPTSRWCKAWSEKQQRHTVDLRPADRIIVNDSYLRIWHKGHHFDFRQAKWLLLWRRPDLEVMHLKMVDPLPRPLSNSTFLRWFAFTIQHFDEILRMKLMILRFFDIFWIFLNSEFVLVFFAWLHHSCCIQS